MNVRRSDPQPVSTAPPRPSRNHPVVLDTQTLLQRLNAGRQPWQSHYYAMYSSIWQGIVTDPRLMLVPFDDHMVHRGDAVFEVFRCVQGAFYNLEAHLDRLERSARGIGLKMPVGRDHLRDLAAATTRAGRRRDVTVRINLSRGPGGFSVDPSESIAPQVYIAAYKTPPSFMQHHPEGAHLVTVSRPTHPITRPVIKSCNYLPNVLMRQAARERGADFAIGHDDAGNITEGATENIAWVSRHGELLLPRNRNILRGTTAERAKKLARSLVGKGQLRCIRHTDSRPTVLKSAAEILLFGTTLPVVSVTRFNELPVGNGQPGLVGEALMRGIENDMRSNSAMRTKVW